MIWFTVDILEVPAKIAPGTYFTQTHKFLFEFSHKYDWNQRAKTTMASLADKPRYSFKSVTHPKPF